jgi:hypothetical protein
MRFPGDLPSPREAQPSDAALDLQGPGQPPVQASEYDGSGQRPNDPGELWLGSGCEHPVNTHQASNPDGGSIVPLGEAGVARGDPPRQAGRA